MDETEVTWQHKIPRWQAQREAWLADVEKYQQARTAFLAEMLPVTIHQVDSLIATSEETGDKEAFLEIYCYKTEYRLFRDLYFALHDYYQQMPAYGERTKLDITDDSQFDESSRSTAQPNGFTFRLTVGWEPDSSNE